MKSLMDPLQQFLKGIIVASGGQWARCERPTERGGETCLVGQVLDLDDPSFHGYFTHVALLGFN